MRNIRHYYLRFYNDKGSYYVSLDQYMQEHQDTYQDEHDDFLYEWADIGRGWQFVPIT